MIRTTIAAVLTSGTLVALGAAQGPARAASHSALHETSATAESKQAEFPKEWFFYGDTPSRWSSIEPKLTKLVGKPAPELTVERWRGDSQSIAGLKGDIVVLDFWGAWCPPCRAALPHTTELAEKLADQSVSIVGVHSKQSADRMEATADQLKVGFPTAADTTGKTAEAYDVQWWPFYVLIDRKGVVRAAGLRPDRLENAIEALLAEQPHEPADNS